MEYYDYSYENFIANQGGKAAMQLRMDEMGDAGWRVHTFTPILIEGALSRYEVLFERVRERE